jgi:ribosomal protein S18 acetylase RimI-like enzyme
MQTDQFQLFTPTLPDDILGVRSLFVEYANSLEIDLCFQNFESELVNLPGEYVQPRGTLIVAKLGERFAGCCALRPLDAVDYPNASEMKRLFVRPDCRGFGIGKALAEAVLDAARHADYSCVLLDTLTEMEAARAMYEDLGFIEIPPYYHNPIKGAHYLMVTL